MSPPEWFEDYEYIVIVFPSHSNSVLEYEYEFTEMSSADINIINSNINLRNYPNPFNPSTTISFETTSRSRAETTAGNSHESSRIEIYNLKGQKIKKLEIRNLKLGINNLEWNGTNENNQPVSSGIYYFKLAVDNKVIATKKMILLK